MGYRIYIGSISKEKAAILSKLQTEKQVLALTKEKDYICTRELLDEDDLLSFGKYVEWVQIIQNDFCAKLLLNHATCDEVYSEHDFFAIDQIGFLEIIKYYDKQILEYYKKLLKAVNRMKDDTQDDDFGLVFDYFRNMANEWGDSRFMKDRRPYVLEGEEITSSNKYSFYQFELARLYKEFDFDNNYMVVHGW